MKNLTKGNPLKLIILFAIPLFIGQLFQLFYNIVDTRIVGETLGETSLAAVGATTALSDMLVGLINGITNGFAIVTAAYFGAQDFKTMKKSIAGTISLSIIITALLSLSGLIFLNYILSFLNISPELVEQSKSYIGIILAGLMASAIYNMCASILRAVGDSFTPLIFLIISTLLNIGLDYLFILYFHMGVSGAAFATVLAQAVSAILCFIYMKKKYPELSLCKKDFVFDKAIYTKLLSTGLSMAFMVSFVNLGTVALQTSINKFNTYIIVAHSAARKITLIFMLPFSVFGTTLATYCSQNYGAGEFQRIKKGIIQTVLVTFVWCGFVFIMSHTISPFLVSAITASDIPEIIDIASLYLRVNTTFYFVTAIICLFRNAMQGFGINKIPVFSSSLELIGKVLIAYFLTPILGYWGVIIAEPIVWFIMVIPLIISMFKFFKKNK